MGIIYSTPDEYGAHLKTHKGVCDGLGDYIKKTGKGEFFTGGSDEIDSKYDGEVKTLEQDYDSALTVKKNNKLIDDIFTAVTKSLKIKVPSDVSTSCDKINWLKSKIPDPQQGKSIVADKGKQATMCKDIAGILNKSFGKTIVNVNHPMDVICNSVNEVVNTMGVDSHKEFVGIAASIQRGLNNLAQLRELLNSSYIRLSNDASKSDDQALSAKIVGMDSLHKALMVELDRQIQLLTNLTTTTLKPVDRDLIEMLKTSAGFKGFISDLNTQMGSKESGAKLAQWLSGVNHVASLASQVNAALKKVGMTLADYRKSSKLSELKIKTDELMQAQPQDKITQQYLGQFHTAVDVLAKNHGYHADIAAYLATHKLGGFDAVEPYTGGAGGKKTWGGRVGLEEKIKKQMSTKNSVLRSFKDKSGIYFKNILVAVVKMSKRIGSDIPINYHLDRFIKTFSELEVVANKDGMEYALTGYQKHATAVAERTRFIGILKSICDSIDPLLNGKGVDSFREIKSNLESMLKLIDFYSGHMNVFEEHSVQTFQPTIHGDRKSVV